MNIPPHYIEEKNSEVVFLVKGGFPVTALLGKWMKAFPPEYSCSVVRCEETFYKLRARANEL